MKDGGSLRRLLVVPLATLVVMLFVVPAQARSEDRHERRDERRDYHHERYEYRRDYHWDHHWHHHPEPVFRYPRPHPRFVVYLPIGGWTVVIGGARYYYCDGEYYRYVTGGYEVVPDPRVEVKYVYKEAPPQNPEPNEFTVNVPRKNGGYTAVVIRRTGNGFVGPQGEFYSEFPSVS